MIGDLFDSPWKILIVAVVIIVLFGSRKLPDAARSLGRSMRILKSEVQGMHEEEPSGPVQATTVQATPAQIQPPADPQAQIAALQQQIDAQTKIDDLQKQLSDLQQQQAK
ncbi:MAG TPA: Sec-independent protein translocase subunit TatA [Trebonia sp.]|nr:Sec-independent protein translocase subunit TatA [Trebonia sp.]